MDSRADDLRVFGSDFFVPSPIRFWLMVGVFICLWAGPDLTPDKPDKCQGARAKRGARRGGDKAQPKMTIFLLKTYTLGALRLPKIFGRTPRALSYCQCNYLSLKMSALVFIKKICD